MNNSALSLANNHIMDYGIDGLTDTCKNLDIVGIKWFGIDKNYETFSNIFFEKSGIRVAIFSYSISEY